MKPSANRPILVTTLGDGGGTVEPLPNDSTATLDGESCKRTYVAQLTYPITICYPPSELLDQVVLTFEDRQNKAGTELDNPKIPITKTLYKLNSFSQGNTVTYGCFVNSGPYYGVVIADTFCHTAESSYTFSIIGVPESISVSWSGQLIDFEAPEGMSMLTKWELVSEICTCCGC